MEEHLERGRLSDEPLEQELYRQNRAIEECLERDDLNEAEHLARMLADPGQPVEFRSDGLHLLGRFLAERRLVDNAVEALDEARRLAVETESYRHAADIQRSVGLLLHDVGRKDEAQEAFRLRKAYEQAAERFIPRRFARREQLGD